MPSCKCARTRKARILLHGTRFVMSESKHPQLMPPTVWPSWWGVMRVDYATMLFGNHWHPMPPPAWNLPRWHNTSHLSFPSCLLYQPWQLSHHYSYQVAHKHIYRQFTNLDSGALWLQYMHPTSWWNISRNNKVNTLRASPQSLSWHEIIGTRNTCSTTNIFNGCRVVL